MLNPREFAVLNARGRDAFQAFDIAMPLPGDPRHPPVNYHGYAASVGGTFCSRVEEVSPEARGVLLLLRKRNLPASLAAARLLVKRGADVRVSFKESGSHQVAEFLSCAKRVDALRGIAEGTRGFLSSTPDLLDCYRALGFADGCYIPTPYPIGRTGWDFSQPLESRSGIFVGTREFSVPSRRHAEAVAVACTIARRTGCRVTVVATEGNRDKRLLAALGKDTDLSVVDGPLPYARYLRSMAGHRIVFQLDRSGVPGQVAGDALLCGILCLGGDGAVDREAFSALPGLPGDPSEAAVVALSDDAVYAAAVEGARSRAAAAVSFEAGAGRLAALFA